MSFLEKIDPDKMPQHIAVIMDGNGRWAKLRNEDRSEGHKEGVSAVRRLFEAATKIGLKYTTIYTFSTENWNRPTEEVEALMALMVQAIVRETPDLIKNGIRLLAIGDLGRLPQKTCEALEECMHQTASCTGLTAILALSYSSRWELVEATRKIADAYRAGTLSEVDENTISGFLTTKGIPDPDLLIRTGGGKKNK